MSDTTIPGPRIDAAPTAPAEAPAAEVQTDNVTVTEGAVPASVGNVASAEVPIVLAPPATPENPIPGPVAIVPVTAIPGPSLGSGGPAKAMPTQVKHPTRAVVRTIFAVIIGVATVTPELVLNAHLDNTALGAQAVVVAGFITRILAMPAVDAFLAKWLPFLSAAPG